MDVSRQETAVEPERGPKARTRRLMLATATDMMQAGKVPSVSDVAEATGVSRATAYRYFPSQAALVHAAVDEALGPILEWQSDSFDVRERTHSLLTTSIPRIAAYEATFRAALKHALDEWMLRNAGAETAEPAFTRGHRIDLLRSALRPLQERSGGEAADRLAKALSLLFGIEAIVILKDIWGAEDDEVQDVVLWAAHALVDAAASSRQVGAGE